MLIAEVLGSVTAPQQVSSLKSHRLLVIRRLDISEEAGANAAAPEVAVDLVGAGPGSRVLVATGSSARLTAETRAVVTDLTIVAIVDSIDLTEGVDAPFTITRRAG